MTRHYLQKFLSITLYYGWFGMMYGSLFAFSLQGYGFDGVWIKRILMLVTLMVTVWFAYRTEMRYHMPTQKYIIVAVIAVFGMSGAATYPHFSWLFFGLFLASIAYKCKDCVAFTRIKP